MDKHGNIYDAEEMRKQLGIEESDEQRREDYKRITEQDKARLDGYLKGHAESDFEAALLAADLRAGNLEAAEMQAKRVKPERKDG